MCRKYQNTFKIQQLFPENRAVNENIWKNVVDWGRPRDNTTHAFCNFPNAPKKENILLGRNSQDVGSALCIFPPPHGAKAPSGPAHLPYRGFTIIIRSTTLGRTPLDE
jgi:hypothetical protein